MELAAEFACPPVASRRVAAVNRPRPAALPHPASRVETAATAVAQRWRCVALASNRTDRHPRGAAEIPAAAPTQAQAARRPAAQAAEGLSHRARLEGLPCRLRRVQAPKAALLSAEWKRNAQVLMPWALRARHCDGPLPRQVDPPWAQFAMAWAGWHAAGLPLAAAGAWPAGLVADRNGWWRLLAAAALHEMAGCDPPRARAAVLRPGYGRSHRQFGRTRRPPQLRPAANCECWPAQACAASAWQEHLRAAQRLRLASRT